MAWLPGSAPTPGSGDDLSQQTGMTPAQIQALLNQAQAQQKQASNSSPTTLYGGIGRMVDAFFGGLNNYRANQAQQQSTSALGNALSNSPGLAPLPPPISMGSPSAMPPPAVTGDIGTGGQAPINLPTASGLAPEQQDVGNKLVASGVTPQGASGLIAALTGESGRHLTSDQIRNQPSENGGVLNPSGAVGMAQWNGPRQADLANFAKQQNADPLSRDTQTQFLLHEINTNPRYAATQKAIYDPNASPQDIMATAIRNYEVPADIPGNIAARAKYLADPAVFSQSGQQSPLGAVLANNVPMPPQRPMAQVAGPGVPSGLQEAQPAAPVPAAGPYTPLPPVQGQVATSAAPMPPPEQSDIPGGPNTPAPPPPSVPDPPVNVPGFPGRTWTRAQAASTEADSSPEEEAVQKAQQAMPAGGPPVAPAPATVPTSAGNVPPPAARPVLPVQQPVAPPQPSVIPDGRGGYVPSTNSRYDPATGFFLPAGGQAAPPNGPQSGGLGSILGQLLGMGGAQAAPAQPNRALANGLQPGIAPPQQPGGPAPAGGPPPVAVPPGGGPAPVAGPAPAAGPVTGAQAAPMTQGQQWDANNRAVYAQLNQRWGVLMQMAARTAGTPASDIYKQQAADVEKQAAPYAAAVMEFGKPPAPPSTASPGVGILNPQTGKYEIQIPKDTEEAKTQGEKEFEYGQQHPEFAKQPRYVPNATYDDLGKPVPGWVYPPSAAEQQAHVPGASMQPPGATPGDVEKEVGAPDNTKPPLGMATPTLNLQPAQQAKLDAIPGARRDMVQAILESRAPLPKITSRGGLPVLLNQDVMSVDPTFNTAQSAAQASARREFLSGGPSSYSKQIEFGNTAINHLADMPAMNEKIPDFSSGALSSVIGGPTAQQAGNVLSSKQTEGLSAINAYKGKIGAFGGELTKYLTGAEGSLTDREAIAARLDPSLPLQARKDAISQYVDTIEGRKSEIQAAWHNAVGPNVSDFPVISPAAQKSLDRIKAWASPQRGAGPANVTPMAAPPATSPAAPAGKILMYNRATGKVE